MRRECGRRLLAKADMGEWRMLGGLLNDGIRALRLRPEFASESRATVPLLPQCGANANQASEQSTRRGNLMAYLKDV